MPVETTRHHVVLLRRGLDRLVGLHGEAGVGRARDELRGYRQAFRNNLLVRALLAESMG